MNINNLSSAASPLQSTYGSQSLDNGQRANEIQGAQNTPPPPPPEAPQTLPAPDDNSSELVNISQEARETLAATEQTEAQVPSAPPPPPPEPVAEPLQEPQLRQEQIQEEQIQQQQLNASTQLYTGVTASPYAATQGTAAQSSIDLVV